MFQVALVSTYMCMSYMYLHMCPSIDITFNYTLPHDQKLLIDFGQLTLLHIILSNPGIYLSEIKDQLTHLVGVEISVSTICRTVTKVHGL